MTVANLLTRLKVKLGITDTSADDLLTAELEDAQSELLLYLNRSELPESMEGYVVRLAALFYERDLQAPDADTVGVKSWNYSEGEQSQSTTLLTTEEYQAGVDAVLRALARYRRVSVKGGEGDESP